MNKIFKKRFNIITVAIALAIVLSSLLTIAPASATTAGFKNAVYRYTPVFKHNGTKLNNDYGSLEVTFDENGLIYDIKAVDGTEGSLFKVDLAYDGTRDTSNGSEDYHIDRGWTVTISQETVVTNSRGDDSGIMQVLKGIFLGDSELEASYSVSNQQICYFATNDESNCFDNENIKMMSSLSVSGWFEQWLKEELERNAADGWEIAKFKFEKVEDVTGLDFTETTNAGWVQENIADTADTGSGGTSDPCYAHGGAMGWVLCPAVTAATDLFKWVYEAIEGDFLQIQAIRIFDENNGVSKAWIGFRNIANVIFIILILLIIFSQITGVGIDNYGIKRMLPRLIMTAILINFSYIVCELAVDITNIVGASLRQFLASGFDISAAQGSSSLSYVTGFSVEIAAAVGYFFVNPGAIVTVLLLLLSMVISVLFLWVILIARQAGVVVGVAIAPLAFAAYLLPNTEKLFKQWFNLMKGLLLLYPICSLVIGGGQLAGKILSNVGSADESAWGVAAMLVQVIPYFAIPSLLRSSINAMGNLGSRLGRAGSQLQSRANQQMQRSDLANRSRIAMNAGGVRARAAIGTAARTSALGRGLGRARNAVGNRISQTALAQAISRRAADASSRIDNIADNGQGFAALGAQALRGARRGVANIAAAPGRAATVRNARAMEAANRQQQTDVQARAIYQDQINPMTGRELENEAYDAYIAADQGRLDTALARMDSQSQKRFLDNVRLNDLTMNNNNAANFITDANGREVGYSHETQRRIQLLGQAAKNNKDFQRTIATKTPDINGVVGDLGRNGTLRYAVDDNGNTRVNSAYYDDTSKDSDLNAMSTAALRSFFTNLSSRGPGGADRAAEIANRLIARDSQDAKSLMSDADKAAMIQAVSQAHRTGNDIGAVLGDPDRVTNLSRDYVNRSRSMNDYATGGINRLMDGISGNNVTANDMRSMLADSDLQQYFATTEGREVQQILQAGIQYADTHNGNIQTFATNYQNAQAANNATQFVSNLASDYQTARNREAADARLVEQQEALRIQRRQDAVERPAVTISDAQGYTYVDSAGAPVIAREAPVGFRTHHASIDRASGDVILFGRDGRRWNATVARELDPSEVVNTIPLQRGAKKQ